MEISSYFEFQGNVFYKKSIIECLIEAKNMKAVGYFVHEIIKNGYKSTINSLIQDLPMLLDFQKIDIN